MQLRWDEEKNKKGGLGKGYWVGGAGLREVGERGGLWRGR